MAFATARRRVLQRAGRSALAAVALPMVACATRNDTLVAALDRQLHDNAMRYGIPGQAVVVQHNGLELYRRTHGFADVAARRELSADQVYPLYSVSKLFASMLVMQLVAQRQIDLNQPASRYVAGLPSRWASIRVAEFLNHVSGVPEYFDPH
jgi:CubicO group peptidase (beta-lactamase class C family)